MTQPIDDEQPALPRLPPAPLGRRVAAGIIDGVVVFALGFTLFWVPFARGAPALPVLSMLAAILGYTVVPLAAFGATPAMALLGVELVGRDGRPPDLVELLFREVIGRGLGPAAYLGSFVFAVLGAMMGHVELGSMGFGAGIAFYLSALLLLAAAGGHFLALTRDDRRTLADLVGSTMVIPRAVAAVQTDADEDERAERSSARRAKIRNVVIFELLLAAVTVVAPINFGSYDASAHGNAYTLKLKLDASAKRFEQTPADASLAAELVEGYRGLGEPEKAQAVLARHHAALKSQTELREQSLRKRLVEAPGDGDAAAALIDLLEEENRISDARTVREAAYHADGSPEAQAGYGVWLYEHDLNDDAITELRAAITKGLEGGEVHAYLGYALLQQEKKVEARHELFTATTLDPDLDDVAASLQDLEAEIGPEPRPKPAAPAKKGSKR